jgi:hypothetical protein
MVFRDCQFILFQSGSWFVADKLLDPNVDLVRSHGLIYSGLTFVHLCKVVLLFH